MYRMKTLTYAVIVSLVLVGVAQADVETSAEIYRHRLYRPDAPAFASSADTGTDFAEVASWTGSDDYGEVHASSARAEAAHGELKGKASLGFTKDTADKLGPGDYTRETFCAVAKASYIETVEIEHPEIWASTGGMSLWIEFSLSGTVTSNRDGGGLIQPQYLLEVHELADVGEGGEGDEPMWWQPIHPGQSAADDGAFNKTGFIDVWDYAGDAIELEVSLRVEADNQSMDIMYGPYGGEATVDCLSTATLDSLTVRDDEGDIYVKFAADGTVAENNSGYDDGEWGLTRTPTPEPATLALVAVGGLALLRRRRG